MKLSDYNSKTPVSRSKSQQVFNLHNEYREEQLKKELEVLEAEIIPLRPLPPQVDQLERALDDSQATLIKTLKELADTSTTLENTETSKQKLLKQVKTFSELRSEYERTLGIVATKESQLQNELKIQKNLVLEKEGLLSYKTGLEDKIASLDQDVIKLEQLNAQVNLEYNTVSGQNSDLNELAIKLDKENKTISKLNWNLNQQLGYYDINLKTAKQKIEELTYIKDKLANWGDRLNKNYSQESSKKDALSKQIQDRDGVIADLSSNITEILASREELLAIVQYYKTELSRQRFVGADGLYRQIELPFASEIIKRRYVGTGKPTMLKFKPRGDINDDNAI